MNNKGVKILGYDKQGMPKVMRKRDYFIDGLGQMTLNIISGLIGMLTYFYTDKVGVSAMIAANVLLTAKVVDSITDLIMGKIFDNTHTKYGKSRPWFLWMALPALVVTIALFTVPKNISSVGQMIYLLVTNICASSIVYTAIYIPYASLMVYRTKSVEERNTMGIIRAGFGYLFGMIIAIGLIPITNCLGGNQTAWIRLSIIFGVLELISMLTLFKFTKEVNTDGSVSNDKDSEEEKVPFWKSIKLLFQNRYWVLLLVLVLFSNMSFSIAGASQTYFAKWVLGNDNYVGLMGAVGIIPSIGGFLVLGPMIKKFGQIKTIEIALIMGIIGSAIWAINPGSLVVTLCCGLFTTFSTIPVMALSGPLTAMTVDYNDYKYGVKMTGMTNSAQTFGSKISGGIGGSLIGWLLSMGGYDAALKAQPHGAMMAIYGFTIYIPLTLMVLMLIMAFSLKPLEKNYPTVMATIKKRNAAKDSKNSK